VKTPPKTLEEFMAIALALENEAVDRYGELADMMETHNNDDVARMFRTMVGYETKHVQQIMAQMGWASAPVVPRELVCWPGYESPEAAPIDEVHYLMQPYHALEMALAAEQRAEAFYGQLAGSTTNEAVRTAALELQAEEAEHVALVSAWMSKVPQPDRDWSNDPDPPRHVD
jgi:rubrerythrin